MAYVLQQWRPGRSSWPPADLSWQLPWLIGLVPWLLWAAMIWIMRSLAGGTYHPPTGDAPLSRGRRRLALAVLVLFLLIFMPVPMRPPL